VLALIELREIVEEWLPLLVRNLARSHRQPPDLPRGEPFLAGIEKCTLIIQLPAAGGDK
jgi:hypothetical protein